METNLVFNKIEEHKLSRPYSDCKKEVIYPQSSYAYSIVDCYIFCMIEQYGTICGFSEEFDNFSEYFYSDQEAFFAEFWVHLYACYAQNIHPESSNF